MCGWVGWSHIEFEGVGCDLESFHMRDIVKRLSRNRLATALLVAGSVISVVSARAWAGNGPVTGLTCNGIGVNGCYYCGGNASPGVPPAGCTNGQLQGGAWGSCVSEQGANQCHTQGMQNCGTNVDCATGVQVGQCSTFPWCGP